ncbi:Lysine--tRNA ligase [Planctomycetes bacterium Pan216]|uniref:Lysine--tRNA ligase n=1 Tax=Kolteria novifilia TaxID=2527975 RepID=A0A518B0R1_9BACT|nr:Lysine--tRNA ligase [Planctomycetes bacterium Pan216]
MTEGASKLEQVRIDKLEKIRALGLDPWGGRFDDRQTIADVASQAPEEPGTTTETVVRVAGRILGLRDKGRVVFIDLQDKTGRIQLFIGKKQVGEENWNIVGLLDLWDLVGAEGKLGRTKTGEASVFVESLTLLTKTIAHPPEKYHGAQDIEIRLRRRYLDMIQNPEVLARFESRAKIVRFIREFLGQREFVEVETPTMHSIAGGAAARPFVTHHNALDIELFMRIALELPLKRCLVGGVDRVYEIGRVWRNEGIDASHNPEFTMLELYEAYGDYETMMELTESLIVGAAEALGNGLKLPYGEREIDMTRPWRRATYDELLREKYGFGLDDTEQARAEAIKREIEVDGKHPDVIMDALFEEGVSDELVAPTFVIDYPASICPLTKRKAGNERVAERFELFINGMEVANAYTELNDPLLQEQLFSTQLEGQEEEDSMAKMDHDFIAALKHGMPPAGGLGIGIDRLVMLLTNSQTIRDVIIFPLLRPERGQGGKESSEEHAGDGEVLDDESD